MTATLRIGTLVGTRKRYALPREVLSQRTAILAMSGSGKTYTWRRLSELMQPLGEKWVMLDPTGVGWGVRLSADGKKAGLTNVVVLGGPHGDLPLESRAGALIADVAVDHAESLVVDLSDFAIGEMRTFARDFAIRLFRRKARNRTPLHVVLDEADEFLPQKATGEVGKLVSAFDRLTRQGRSRGIFPIVITQRPARLNKDILTQCDMLVVMRMIAPHDRRAMKEWIEIYGSEEEQAYLNRSIATLDDGEAFFWAPKLRIFDRVQVDRITTYDSMRTPEAGEAVIDPELPPIDADALRERMADLVERAEAEDPRHLQRQVATLKRENADLGRQVEAAKAAQPEPVVERVEVPVLTPEMDARLGEVQANSVSQARDIEQIVTGLLAGADKLAATAVVFKEAAQTVDNTNHPPEQPAAHAAAYRAAMQVSPKLYTPDDIRRREDAPPRSNGTKAAVDPGAVVLKKGARRMLATLVAFHPSPLTRRQLGTLADIRSTGGTFSDYLSSLRRAGYLVEAGDGVRLTDEGVVADDGSEPAIRSLDALVDVHKRRLKAGARRMFDALLAIYPDGYTRADLGAAAEINASGGTFSDYLSSLRRSYLIDEADGIVRVSDTLYLLEGSAPP